MKTWESAADRIRRRNATAIVSSIAVETPFAFVRGVDASEVADYLDSIWESFETKSDVVFSLAGRDVNFARDLLIAVLKYFHVISNAEQLLKRGARTWMLVDAYHAALLGSRAVAAFHGILSYTVKKRTILIDYRPSSGARDDQKQFNKNYKFVSEPVRLLRPYKEKLDQKESWALLERLCRISDNAKESHESKFDKELLVVAKQPLSTIRNRILYDSVYWTWRQDFTLGSTSNKALSSYDGNDEQSALIAGLSSIHQAVVHYVSKLFVQIGIDPVLFPEVGLQPAFLKSN